MKISDTADNMFKDMLNIDGKEIVSITFAGITWKMQLSSLIKIFEYANKYFESNKPQS